MRALTIVMFFLMLTAFVLEFSLGFRLSNLEGLSFKNIGIYGIVLLTLIGNAMTGRSVIAPGPITWPAIFFVVYCTISLFLTGLFKPVPNYSIFRELLAFKVAMDPYVLLVVVFSLVHDERTIKAMLQMLVALLLLFLVITLLGSFNFVHIGRVYLHEGAGRTRGAFAEWNQYPLYVVTFMPLVAVLLLDARNRVTKALYLGILGLSGFNVLLSGSRGALVALVAAVGVYHLLASRKSLGSKLAGVIGAYAVVMVGMLALYYLLPSTSAEIFASKISGAYFDSGRTETDYSSGRLGLWEASLKGFLGSPIVGTGWRTFVPLYGGNSHNDYLLYLVTTGVIGFYLFVLVFVRMLKTAYQHSRGDASNRRLYYAFLAGMTAYMTGSFLVNIYTPAYFVFIYAALMLRLGFVVKPAVVPAEVASAGTAELAHQARNRILQPRKPRGLAGAPGASE